MGTPLYMSPEQVEGKTVDPRSDIYSLGITAYHMLAGDPPFQGDNPLAIALQHVNKSPPSLHSIRADVPRELSDIVERMMAKYPVDRFQDPTELIRAIRKIEIDFDQWDTIVEKLAVDSQQPEYVSPTSVESRYAVTRQLQRIMTGDVPSFWRRVSTWWSLAAVVIVAFSAGAIWALQRPPTDPLAAVNSVSGAQTRIVPQKASAKAQYYYALFHPELKDQGWLAVDDYFSNARNPDLNSAERDETAYYIYLARERLGEFYLKQGWYELAHDVYQRLLIEPYEPGFEYEARFKTVGHMGLAIYYDEVGDAEHVKDALYEVEMNKVDPGFLFLNKFLSDRYRELCQKYVGGTSDRELDPNDSE